MTVIPSCASKRYSAIDELVDEMSRQDARSRISQRPVLDEPSAENLGAELLCKFWHLLKNDPQFDLEGAIDDRLKVCIPEEASCFSAVCTCGKHANYEEDRKCNEQEVLRDICTICIDKPSIVGAYCQPITNMRCEISRSAGSCSSGTSSKKSKSNVCLGLQPPKRSKSNVCLGLQPPKRSKSNVCLGLQPPKRSKSNVCPTHSPQKPTPHFCGVGKVPKETSNPCIKKCNEPLTEALQGIKMAQKHDSNCAWRLSDLMETEERICQYVQRLEVKELTGISQLQEADTMWSNMEYAYLNKLRESKEKQDKLLSQEMEIRESISKWQKKEKSRLKRQIEVQANMCNIEDQVRKKKKQLEKLTNECDSLSRRIDSAKKELDQLHTNSTKKINTVQKAQNKITSEISSLERRIEEARRKREAYEQQGRGSVRRASELLCTTCQVLLQSQLYRENLNAEEKSLNLDMSTINESISICNDQCQLKLKPLRDEIIAVEEDITRNNLKCVRCNACVSTSDIKKRCTDCPRCLKGTCQYKDKTCSSDDCGCVCPDVKEKFVENILDNMYSILESDMKKNGSHLASDVLKCLKKSTSGRLDTPTRHRIHNYVMNAVCQDLDAIISGAGVKTKCEIGPEQLKQLNLCLNEVVLREKTAVKARNASDRTYCQTQMILNITDTCSCKRWGSNAPCNCPGGCEACVCRQRAPSRGSSTRVNPSRSGILKKVSHSTPKAHSCAAGSGEVATVTSRLSLSSTRKVCMSKKSVCACSGSAMGRCKCSRSRSKASITSRSSNAQYTACVRDKLIKDVTNVASKSPSTHSPICRHSSGSCTCIEEKELKLHRPRSRASYTSTSSGARLLSRPDVAVVPCPAKRKPSPPVCDPPQDMSGSGFFKRFSAASIRQSQASDGKHRDGTNSSGTGGRLKGTDGSSGRAGRGKNANDADDAGGSGTGRASGAGGRGGGGSGGLGANGIGGAAVGNGGAGASGAGTEGAGGTGAGRASDLGGAGAGGTGRSIGGAGISAGGAGISAGGAGISAGGAGITGGGAGIRAGGAGISAGGAGITGGGAGISAGGAGISAGGAGISAGGAGISAGGAGITGGGAGISAGGAGITGGGAGITGEGAGITGGGAGISAGGAGISTSDAGADGGTRGGGTVGAGGGAKGAGTGGVGAAGKLAKRRTKKMSDSALSNVTGLTAGKDSPGKTDSGICSRNSSPCKPSPDRSSPEPSIPVCDPRKCTGPCKPLQRESAIGGWSKTDDVKLRRPQTNFIKPLMKDSCANTDNAGNLTDDPCFRSYIWKLRATRGTKKRQILTCNYSPADLLKLPNFTGEHRRGYKDPVMEPQLPAFLKHHQLPKRTRF